MRYLARMLLATVIAASLPGAVSALPTDILGNSPLLHMNDADKKLLYDAVVAVLKSSDVRAVRDWENAATGFTGRVQAQGDMTSSEGLQCRRLQLRTQVRGLQSQFAFPFCKDPKGEWFIASGMKFSDDAARR
ncbi:RT0821/Lpp0805 family surface protein [Peristeroidobacter soli]|uniref:RT0821/Lpp0805 family surface protein n=1 Tax=Peristeroidobacter soli TaxID=2497877 RepID=UPI00101CFBE7|nr:RT0821/Lpp0805 family surface protein [Peristeroidobacter soli]